MLERLKESDRKWTEETYEKIRTKMRAECARIGSRIPYIAENGVYREDKAKSDIIWWTNGFWPGMLWQMYHADGEEQYRTAAEGAEEKLDRAFDIYTGLHHDVGFMWLHSAVADFRLTGNERSKARGLHASPCRTVQSQGKIHPFLEPGPLRMGDCGQHDEHPSALLGKRCPGRSQI